MNPVAYHVWSTRKGGFENISERDICSLLRDHKLSHLDLDVSPITPELRRAIESCKSLKSVSVSGGEDLPHLLSALACSSSQFQDLFVSGQAPTGDFHVLVAREIKVEVSGEKHILAALDALRAHPNAGWKSLVIQDIFLGLELEHFRMRQPQLSLELPDLLMCGGGPEFAKGLLGGVKGGEILLMNASVPVTGRFAPAMRWSEEHQDYVEEDMWPVRNEAESINKQLTVACLRGTAMEARSGRRASDETLTSFMMLQNYALQVPAKEFTRDHPGYLNPQEIASVAGVDKATAAAVKAARLQGLGAWLVFHHEREVPHELIRLAIKGFPEAPQLEEELERLSQREGLSFPLTKW